MNGEGGREEKEAKRSDRKQKDGYSESGTGRDDFACELYFGHSLRPQPGDEKVGWRTVGYLGGCAKDLPTPRVLC
jgi:hypothetical protein